MKKRGVIVIQKRFGLELVYEGNTMPTLESGIGTGGTMIPRVAYEEDDEAMGIWQDGKSKNAGRVPNLQGTESHEHIECE